MSAPGSPVVRVVRAAFVGLWVVVGAALGHATQGGPPPVVALAPVTIGVIAVVWWAGTRRLPFVAVLALLGLSQLVVHLLSSYVHGHVMTPSLSMLVAHLAAVALVAAGVADADRLWWAWWERTTLIVHLRSHAVPAVVALAVPTTWRVAGHSGRLAHVVVRRGPPPT